MWVYLWLWFDVGLVYFNFLSVLIPPSSPTCSVTSGTDRSGISLVVLTISELMRMKTSNYDSSLYSLYRRPTKEKRVLIYSMFSRLLLEKQKTVYVETDRLYFSLFTTPSAVGLSSWLNCWRTQLKTPTNFSKENLLLFSNLPI